MRKIGMLQKAGKISMSLVLVSILIMSCVVPIFAAGANFGQNTGSWIMEQAFWLALAVVAVVAVGFIIKRAWVACLVFVIISAIVLSIIKNPAMLQSIGDSLLGIVLGN